MYCHSHVTIQCNCLIISVEATTIEMTKVPQVAIEEKNEAQYECETSSAYPEPPSVLWYVDDDPVGVNDEHTVENNPSSGDHHGQKTKSTLRLTTNREMNMKKVKCVLENDDTKFNEHSLNVTCKYLPVHIYQKLELKVFCFVKSTICVWSCQPVCWVGDHQHWRTTLAFNYCI